MTLRCLIVDNNRGFGVHPPPPGARGHHRRRCRRQQCRGAPARRGAAAGRHPGGEDLGSESGLELARRLHREATMAPSPVILISTYAKEDFADLIAATPAIGFLPKYAVTASAIRDLLARHGHTDPGDRVSRPPEG